MSACPAGPWLTVVGTLADGTLAPGADRAILEAAEAVFGAERLLAAAGVPEGRRVVWPRPFEKGLEALLARRGRPVAVLATGDPMHHGVGATLSARLAPEEMTVWPAPSAFSLAAARLRWPLQASLCLSLHDRPVETIHRHVAPGRRLIVLSRDGDTPAAVARYLTGLGLGATAVTVLERMGTATECITQATASDGLPVADPLNVVALACAADGAVDPAAGRTAPGLPDGVFAHDGQLTKKAVRAATLAALAPRPGEHLWDIGAGCGSVAIEWCRAADGATAAAFEREPARLDLLARNCRRLGTPEVEIVAGDAQAGLAGRMGRPDAVFLGGAVAEEALFEAAFAALLPGGRLLANAVTLEATAALIDRQRRLGGELCRIAIEEAEPVGRLTAFRPRMPVVRWHVDKPL